MKYNENMNVKGVVIGSSASISSMNAVQYVGTGTASTFGTLVLSNSDVSFGMAGSTITATHTREYAPATLYIYPAVHGQIGWAGPDDINFFPNNAGDVTTTGANTWTTTITYIGGPMPDLMGEVHYNVVEVWGEHNVNVPGVTTASGSAAIQYGLFTRTGLSLFAVTTYVLNERQSQNGEARTFRVWSNTVTNLDSTTYTFADSNALNASFSDGTNQWMRFVLTSGTAVSTLFPSSRYYVLYGGSSRRAGAASPSLILEGGQAGHYGHEATTEVQNRVGSASAASFFNLDHINYTFSTSSTAESSVATSLHMPTSMLFGFAVNTAASDIRVPLLQFIRST